MLMNAASSAEIKRDEDDEEQGQSGSLSRELTTNNVSDNRNDRVEVFEFTREQFLDFFGGLSTQISLDSFAWRNLLYGILAGHINNSAAHTASVGYVVSVSNLLVIGVSTLFSINIAGSQIMAALKKAKTENNHEKVERLRQEINDYFRYALTISAIGTPFFTGIMVFSGDILHNIFRQDEKVSYLAQGFLRPYSPVVLPTFLWMSAAQITMSARYMKAFWPTVVLLGLDAFFSVGLGLGKMGLPKLGELGLLASFLPEAYLSAILYNGILVLMKPFKELKLMNIWEPTTGNFWQKFKDKFFDALPITTGVAVEMLYVLYFHTLSGFVATKTQAAFSLTTFYIVFSSLLGVHSAVAAAMMLGEKIGHEQHTLVYQTTRAPYYYSLAVCSVVPIICAAYPQVLMKIFNTNDPEIKSELVRITPYVSAAVVLDALAYLRLIQQRVFGDRWNSTRERVISFILGGLVGAGLLKLTRLGTDSIGIGFLIGMALAYACGERRFGMKLNEYRQKNNLQPYASVSQQWRKALPKVLPTGLKSKVYPFAIKATPAAGLQ